MKKKLILGLVLLTALAGSALAQLSAGKKGGPPPPSPEELEQKREAAKIDKQYRDALKRSGSETTPTRVDPWANMRGTEAGTKR